MAWEYMAISRSGLEDTIQLEECLNRHGEMGWELVSVGAHTVVLKKPVAAKDGGDVWRCPMCSTVLAGGDAA